MKFNHNKKRNTAFIYETLIKELSKASMQNQTAVKNKVLSILKEFFRKGRILKQELEIYKSFEDLRGLEENMIGRVIQEAKKQFSQMDRETAFKEQTRVVNRINKELGPSTWGNFVKDYKRIATVSQVLSESLGPKKQVLLESKLIQDLAKPEPEKKAFPNVNNLALKTFVKNFNEEYSQSLNESQKSLLHKYINSYQDDGLEFKVYLYEEVTRLKAALVGKIKNQDEDTANKLERVVEQIGKYNQRKINRDLVAEIVKIQALVENIK
jgi:hypothetical protein